MSKRQERPLAHCIIIVRRGCAQCQRLLTLLRQPRYQFIRQYVPIVDVETARRWFEYLFKKAVKTRVDEYGNVWEYVETPCLVCYDMDEPVRLDFTVDEEAHELLEMIRSRIIVLEHTVAPQIYRGRVRVGRRSSSED